MDAETMIAQLAAALAAQQLVLEHVSRAVGRTNAMDAALVESREMLGFVRAQLGPAPTELLS